MPTTSKSTGSKLLEIGSHERFLKALRSSDLDSFEESELKALWKRVDCIASDYRYADPQDDPEDSYILHLASRQAKRFQDHVIDTRASRRLGQFKKAVGF